MSGGGLHNGFNNYRTIPGGGEPPSMLQVADGQLGWGKELSREQSPIALITAEGKSQDGLIATIHAQVSDVRYPTAGPDRRAPIKGLLQWGQGGASFTAEIDIRTGVCASLVATTVRLNAVYEANDDPDADARATQVRVAAAVVWGTRPGRGRATRTLPRTTIAIAGAATFEVPPFAYSLTFFTPISAFYGAASTNVITLHGGPLVTDDPELIVTSGQLTTQPLVFDGLLLSGNTRFVTVANTTGAPLPIRACFGLEL